MDKGRLEVNLGQGVVRVHLILEPVAFKLELALHVADLLPGDHDVADDLLAACAVCFQINGRLVRVDAAELGHLGLSGNEELDGRRRPAPVEWVAAFSCWKGIIGNPRPPPGYCPRLPG